MNGAASSTSIRNTAGPGVLFGRRDRQRPSHTVLLVDDDDDVRETSADMLEELGYIVTQAASGAEALAKLEANPELEVMVTDIRMPGMSGLELSELAGNQSVVRAAVALAAQVTIVCLAALLIAVCVV